MNTSKLIEKRIELNSSSVFATADAERGPPDPALGEASFAMGWVDELGVSTVCLSKKRGASFDPPLACVVTKQVPSANLLRSQRQP
jgi:hypothetical protein